VAAAAFVFVLAGCGSAGQPAGTAAGAVSGGNQAGGGLSTVTSAYLVQVQARVLVDGAGYALYMFVPDHQQRVTCTALCAKSWPPVFEVDHHPPRATGGVRSALLGADTDPAGGQVVTYNRWPLYTYADDPQPGFATGQGVDLDGGYWYLVRADGTPLVPAGDPAATGPPTP
jgi:predicted lipoprotein with Yx(FWY)xxD motif